MLEIPATPEARKIQNLLCKQRYQDVAKAGELTVRLAVIMFGEETLKKCGLSDNQGKLIPLNETRIAEIEDVIKRLPP